MPIMPKIPEMSIIPAREWTGRTGQRRGWRLRKETEKFGRGEEGFLMKKAMRWVGLAYRELIGSLYESWTIGIERVYK